MFVNLPIFQVQHGVHPGMVLVHPSSLFAKNCVKPKCYARHGKRSQNTEKTHGPNHDQRKRRYTRGCNPKRHGAKATTTKAVCVLMPFLPKICYYVNCFRTCQPPTRMWETISRAGWPSSTDAAGNALFAHMPYLWNLRPEHQRIWANPKQTQTIQWPRVPPNGMACTVTTNDQFRLACLLQLSA